MTQLTVYDANHTAQQLDMELGRGGEGTVYTVHNVDQAIAKLYHKAVLDKRGAMLKSKVEAMRSVAALQNEAALSWPRINLYDENQQWIGYAMRRAQGKPMSRLAHAMLYTRHFPNLDRRDVVSYLVNMLKQIKKLHKHGVMIGDYNLDNFICDPHSKQVNFIDCDSYQINVGGVLYPCPVGSPDMTPKEHHGQNFSKIKRTLESEYFSIAIILFKCLMLGRHPYDIVGGNDPVSNIKTGNFPYGLGNRGIPAGPWYNIWSHMPHRIKSAFIKTFETGATQPAERTTVEEWLDVLQLYNREMNRGWHETAIRPAKPKTCEYRGTNASISTDRTA